MPSRSTLVSEIQQLLTGERADPRAAQAVFLVPVAVELAPAARRADGPRRLLRLRRRSSRWCPRSARSPSARGYVDARWTIWLPVLDIVALGTFRLSDGTAIGIAVAFPAIWLGLQFGRKGVSVTVVDGAGRLRAADPDRVRAHPGRLLAGHPGDPDGGHLLRRRRDDRRAVEGPGRARPAAARSRLERAMTDVIEQRRLTRTIVNSVDVGLVAIDASGAYDSMNPRHEEFMALAYPDGHGGMAGQTGLRLRRRRGHPAAPARSMPTSRAVRGEAFRDYLIWVGRGPGRATGAGRLLDAVLPQRRRVRRGRAGLPRHHRAGDGLADQGRVRGLGQPRAAHAADLDHRLRRRDPRGHRRTSPTTCATYLVTVQRNSRRLHRLVDDLLSTRCSRSPRSSTCSGSRCRRAAAAVRRARRPRPPRAAGLDASSSNSGAAGDDLEHRRRRRAAGPGLRQPVQQRHQVHPARVATSRPAAPGGRPRGGPRQRHRARHLRGRARRDLHQVLPQQPRCRPTPSPASGWGWRSPRRSSTRTGARSGVSSEVGRGTTFEVRLPLAGPRRCRRRDRRRLTGGGSVRLSRGGQ